MVYLQSILFMLNLSTGQVGNEIKSFSLPDLVRHPTPKSDRQNPIYKQSLYLPQIFYPNPIIATFDLNLVNQ